MANPLAYVEGLDTLKRLIDPPDALLAAPWKEALTKIADEGAAGGRSQAPSRSGRLQQKISAAVQKKPFPMWAAVRSRGRAHSAAYPKGYAYPTMLEYSPKHGHAGWFTRGVRATVESKAEVLLGAAARQIAGKWGS